jgi:outer membrane protein assembly factor BamA
MRFALKHYCAAVGMLVTGITVRAQMSMSDNSVLFSTNGTTAVSDTNRMFVIRDIVITGNNKTQPSTILRELPFDIEEGYPLSVIAEKFKKARKQLMNTGLFRDVIVSLKSLDGYDVNVSVEVQEKWYIWPRVFVRTVDKSFGQWWNEKDRSMDRINYGIRLAHNNITGRNDKLKVAFMNGYTRQFSLQYYGLWLDRQMKWSTNAGVSFGKNKEVNYMTLFNKQVPIKDNNEFLRSYVSGFLQVNYRPKIKTTHTFGFGYTYEDVADTVFKLNPSFYYNTHAVRFPEISYRLSYFDVDFIPYPTKGLMGEVSLKKRGFTETMNLWELSARISKTWSLSSKAFFNLKGMGMVKLPFSQPYIGKQFIGYEGRFLQGYEYYVIDGVAGGYAKANISRLIFNTHIAFPSQRFRRLNYIPIKLYAKTFANAGYVYDNNPGENKLASKMLYSGGIGLDFITCNDFVIKIEWSFNRLGENGLYLHQRNDF